MTNNVNIKAEEKQIKHVLYPTEITAKTSGHCGIPLSVDLFNSCAYGCTYCSSKGTSARHFQTTMKAYSASSILTNLTNILSSKKEATTPVKHFIKQRKAIQIGTTTDPMQPAELKYRQCYQLMQGLKDLDYSFMLTTKSNLVARPDYLKLLSSFSKRSQVILSFSTFDHDLASKIELRVPPVAKRIETVKALADKGVTVVIKLAPYIMRHSDRGLEDALKQLKGAVKTIVLELLVVKVATEARMTTFFDTLGCTAFEYFTAVNGETATVDAETIYAYNPLKVKPEFERVKQLIESYGVRVGANYPHLMNLSTDACRFCCDGGADLNYDENCTVNLLRTGKIKEYQSDKYDGVLSDIELTRVCTFNGKDKLFCLRKGVN